MQDKRRVVHCAYFGKGAVATPHPLKMVSQEFQDEDSRRTLTNREVWWDLGRMVLAFIFELNTLLNAFGWVDAKGLSPGSLNLPFNLSLPHTSTTHLRGSSTNSQDLYMITSGFIWNYNGQMEKWKIKDVKEFAQKQKLVTFQSDRAASK